MMQVLDPYVSTIVEALIGALVTVIMGAIALLGRKINKWIDTRDSADQRAFLHRLAAEGMALAEAAYKDHGGQAKLNAAVNYVLDRAREYGLKSLTMDSVEAAIEKAVLDYNAKKKVLTQVTNEPTAPVLSDADQRI
ncbi:phage holin, LLH family [Paenibacillus methanolicus]|uniref:Superfamily 6 holin (LLH) n=1 Tax=Paenibacillus methanolicus TaxID=582686 RepID=A0A5S5BKW0_9BACL|nr:phage holin, LLH family [Paenibacillus methanolicus]TYP67709.1 superfamily 6 holin (LLH) [Paenibacillus methanolicus]